MDKQFIENDFKYREIENSISDDQGIIFKALIKEEPNILLYTRDYTFGQVVLLMVALEDTLKYLIKDFPEAYAITLDADLEITKYVEWK